MVLFKKNRSCNQKVDMIFYVLVYNWLENNLYYQNKKVDIIHRIVFKPLLH